MCTYFFNVPSELAVISGPWPRMLAPSPDLALHLKFTTDSVKTVNFQAIRFTWSSWAEYVEFTVLSGCLVITLDLVPGDFKHQ